MRVEGKVKGLALKWRQAIVWSNDDLVGWLIYTALSFHDDFIKWKHLPRYWPFARVIHRSPVNSPHKAQWRGALMFSLICVWINGWVNNREGGGLRRYRAHYGVIVMWWGNWMYVSLTALLYRISCMCLQTKVKSLQQWTSLKQLF